MKNTTSVSKHTAVEFVDFPFHAVRNISTPEDKENGRTILAGNAPLPSILPLNTDENVRSYLPEAEGKLRRRQTQVNVAIRDTLDNYPDKFSVLNSGVVIVSRAYNIDENKKILYLLRPSIINGAQTQGVVRDYYRDCERSGIEPSPIHITFQILVTDNESLIAETSIARNFQNDVMTVSIAGRLGQLNELEKALQKRKPDKKLQKSETELSEDYLNTEKLLQVIAALTPPELWPNDKEKSDPNKVYTYSQKAKCLKDFRNIYEKQKDLADPEQPKYKALYKFYLDIVADAQDLYDKWKSHQGFIGTRIKAIQRDHRGRTIQEVPDGIIFPILAALSAFATHTPEGWKILPPVSFRDADMIRAAASSYQTMASSNPNLMGKSRACYLHLSDITSIYKRLSEESRQP
jgi:AIPR protein.